MSRAMFSLKNIAQAGSKAKAAADEKAREDKLALDSVMADFERDHGGGSGKRNVLGELADEHEVPPDAFVPTGAKRHFTNKRSTKSGPGTLPSEPGLGFARTGATGVPQARFGAPAQRGPAEESVYTSVVAKASNLPPTIDQSRVEALFSDFPALKVLKIERLPPSRPSSPTRHAQKRPSTTMKVFFSKDAKPRDFDTAMSKLNDKKYMGKGYYLHLDRFLGSGITSTRRDEQPFAATLHDPLVAEKGVAPPEALGGQNRIRAREEAMNKRLLVTANAPPDQETLRLVHQTIEKVIEGGTEFEAALMNNPRVQEEERFAWLYDQKHALNRYYRWRLYQIVAMSDRTDVFLHQPDWKGPKDSFVDEFASKFEDIAYDPPAQESDEEGDDETPIARFTVATGDNYPGRDDTGYGIMSPKSKTMLIWMLASVPHGSLLNEDLAPFGMFAVQHYTQGMDEVVNLLITNIFQPFALSKANPKRADVEGEGDDSRPLQRQQLAINALYIVHDVIMVTYKGQSFCYKYRTFFATQLRDRKVFAYLDTLPSQLSMGLPREVQFRKDINQVLAIWREDYVFETPDNEAFDDAFNARKMALEKENHERKQAEKAAKKKGAVPQKRKIPQLDGANEEDYDDEGLDENGDVEEEDEDKDDDDARMDVDHDIVAGVGTLDGANDAEKATDATEGARAGNEAGASGVSYEDKQSAISVEIPGETAAARARRLRPKAEDMFASDEE